MVIKSCSVMAGSGARVPVRSAVFLFDNFVSVPLTVPVFRVAGPGTAQQIFYNTLSRSLLVSAALTEFIHQPGNLCSHIFQGRENQEEGGQLPLLIITALLTRLPAPDSGQRNYQTNINILEQSHAALHTDNHQGEIV